MKALILRKNANATASCAQALIDKGFQVACVETRKVARALIQLETIDLLVMDEMVDGRLTHALALSAERRNPYVSAIIVTDRTGPDTDELYDLIPCLYGLVGSDSSGRLISQLALSSTENYDEAEARVRRQALLVAEDEGEDDDEALWLAYDVMMETPDADDPEAEAVEADEVDDGAEQMAVAAMDQDETAALGCDDTQSPTEADLLVLADRVEADGAIDASDYRDPIEEEPLDLTEDQAEAEDMQDLAFEVAEQAAQATAEQKPTYIAFDEAQFASLTASHSFTQLGPRFTPDNAMMQIAAAS